MTRAASATSESTSVDAATWERYQRALAGGSLPAAFIDLDAVDANIDRDWHHAIACDVTERHGPIVTTQQGSHTPWTC